MFHSAGEVNSRGGAVVDLHVKFLFVPHVLKSFKTSLLATTAFFAVLPHPALAQSPTGGSVVAGTAGISQAGAVTNINQSTQKAIINWQGFSVGAQNTVNFNQPNSSAATLNRVIGNEQSIINGAINANGQVFIVNSAGVLFGKGSQVNVGGIVASTLDISNNDFMAGNYKFSGTSNASVVNQGRIRAHGGGQGGGYVALLGKTVSNEGMIAARLGTVAMAAGEKITLNFGGDSLLDVTIDKGTLNALVQNKRAIIANGGQVIMTAKAADQVLSAQVNNSGVIQARTMAALKGGGGGGKVKLGKIILYAHGGTTNVSGKLDASAPKGGDGGFIETSGDHVKIADNAIVTTFAPYGKTGTWLIDPTDFNIVAGNAAQTTSGIGAGTLAGILASTNFAVMTFAGGAENGDINVNASVNWSANTTLTLTAANNININQAITATGASAGLALNAGNNININNAVRLDGANATLAMNYGGNYNIRTPASYSGVAAGPVYDKAGNPVYELVLKQVLEPVAKPDGTKAGFVLTPVYDEHGNPKYELVPGNQAVGPVAAQDTSGGVYGSVTFTNGANTSGLTVNGTTYTLIHSLNAVSTTGTLTGNYALAQTLDAATWSSVNPGRPSVIATFSGTFAGLGHTVTNLTINTTSGNAGLFGRVNAVSAIRDIGLVNANVTNTGSFTGALVGWNNGGTVSNAFVTGTGVGGSGSTVIGRSGVGGLVGLNFSNASISSSIRSSFSNADVSGTVNVGGLVGQNTGAGSPNPTVNTSVTPNVISYNLGAYTGGIIDSSYATGKVTNVEVTSVMNFFGGLVGLNGGGLVSNSYASGDVTLTRANANNGPIGTAGGLVGRNLGSGSSTTRVASISNSFADGNVTAPRVAGNSDPSNMGGLVGDNTNGYIVASHATGDVNVPNRNNVGGLVGLSQQASGSGLPLIDRSFASGNVIALESQYVGGLVGRNVAAPAAISISNSYYDAARAPVEVAPQAAPGVFLNVAGFSSVGGFAGLASGTIVAPQAFGIIGGTTNVGGVIGTLDSGTTVYSAFLQNSQAGGSVLGVYLGFGGGVRGQSVGGAVGFNRGNISGFQGSASVTCNSSCGGVVGQNDAAQAGNNTGGTVANSNNNGLVTGNNDATTSSTIGSNLNTAPGAVSNVTGTGFVSTPTSRAQVAVQAAANAAAAQAAAAQVAAAQQVARTANSISNNAVTSSLTPPDLSMSDAGTRAAKSAKSAAIDGSVKSVDDAVKTDDKRQEYVRERERRRTAQTNRRGREGGGGGGLGATIRSIDVNGQRFDLQNGAPKTDAPAQAPQ